MCSTPIETSGGSYKLPDACAQPAAPTADAEYASVGTAVVGVGNILMGDDGIGIVVVERLRAEAALPQGTELYDAGTALLDVLPLAARKSRMILVDSCRAGGTPGTVYRSVLYPDDLQTAPPRHSLHDLDAVHALRLHRLSGGRLGEVVLIGVEPAEIVQREGLSPVLQKRLPDIVRAVRNELLESPSKSRRGGET